MDEKERKRLYNQAYRERAKTKPDYAEKQRELQKKKYRQLCNNPVRFKQTREKQRLCRRKKRQNPKEKLAINKEQAADRGYCWEITDEHAIKLYTSPCHYCHRIGSGYDPNNGIDRKDTFKGYTAENSLPCCGMCNFAKGRRSYEQMMEYIETIANNRRDLLRNPITMSNQ